MQQDENLTFFLYFLFCAILEEYFSKDHLREGLDAGTTQQWQEKGCVQEIVKCLGAESNSHQFPTRRGPTQCPN